MPGWPRLKAKKRNKWNSLKKRTSVWKKRAKKKVKA